MLLHLIRRFSLALVTNFWLKIGSFIVAVIIWFSINSQGRTDKTFLSIPYEVRNIPLNLEITERDVEVVKITLRGPQNLLSSLKPESISVVLSLPDTAEPGVIQLDVSRNNITAPYINQFSVLQILPETISFRLEKTITKTVSIKPFLRGSPSPDYELGTWEAIPPEAQIMGPTSIIEQLDTVLTEPIDINGVNMRFNERVELMPQNHLVRVVYPQRVTVVIEIKEKIIERSFTELEFKLISSNSETQISVSPPITTLFISGPQRILNQLQNSDIDIIADCRDLPPGEHVVPLILASQPNGIISFTLDPASVEVMIPTPISNLSESLTPSPSPAHNVPASSH